MTLKHVRYFKLAALVATLWSLYLGISYLVPWPLDAWWIELLAPTIVSSVFAVLAHRLRVASWPVVISFSLAFFVEGIAEPYVNSPTLHEATASMPANVSILLWATALTLWSVISSPILLWGPLLSAILVYGVLRRHNAGRQ
jgi:hypothetical protein